MRVSSAHISRDLVRKQIVEAREGEFLDRAGDDGFAVDVQLHAESRVDAAELEETAAERASGERGIAPLRKEQAAADAHASFLPGDDENFVEMVAGNDRQRLHVRQLVDLAAVGPVRIG